MQHRPSLIILPSMQSTISNSDTSGKGGGRGVCGGGGGAERDSDQLTCRAPACRCGRASQSGAVSQSSVGPPLQTHTHVHAHSHTSIITLFLQNAIEPVIRRALANDLITMDCNSLAIISVCVWLMSLLPPKSTNSIFEQFRSSFLP